MEDLEIIVQLKKRKKYKKTKVPVVKEPEPEVIVRMVWFPGLCTQVGCRGVCRGEKTAANP